MFKFGLSFARVAALFTTPPIYLMTEALVVDGGFSYIPNSSVSGAKYNMKLLTSGDAAWTPGAAYPGDGTIDFSGGNKGDTQWIPSATKEWVMPMVYDVVIGTSYKIFSLHYNGDNTADVWYGDESTGLALAGVDTGLAYTPPTSSMVLNEHSDHQLLPAIPTCVITMDDYALTAGETATVTFTFNVVPTGFTLDDVTAENGALSSLTQGSDATHIFTATFTPTAEVSDATNVITVTGSTGQFTDAWGNASTANFTSSNYTVNTVTATNYLSDVQTYDDNADEITTYARVSANEFNQAVTSTGTNGTRPRLQLLTTPTILPAGNYKLKVDVTVNSGTPIFVQTYAGTTVADGRTLSTGYYEFNITATGLYSNVYIYMDGRNLYSVNFANMVIHAV